MQRSQRRVLQNARDCLESRAEGATCRTCRPGFRVVDGSCVRVSLPHADVDGRLGCTQADAWLRIAAEAMLKPWGVLTAVQELPRLRALHRVSQRLQQVRTGTKFLPSVTRGWRLQLTACLVRVATSALQV